MGRQSSDSIVIKSSIALLQERFKQLQRAKEMREERELLRLLSESARFNTTMPYEPSGLFFHSELILPPRPPPIPNTLHLKTNLQLKQNDPQITETPILANLWSREAVMHRTNVFDDGSDVDTSLHL